MERPRLLATMRNASVVSPSLARSWTAMSSIGWRGSRWSGGALSSGSGRVERADRHAHRRRRRRFARQARGQQVPHRRRIGLVAVARQPSCQVIIRGLAWTPQVAVGEDRAEQGRVTQPPGCGNGIGDVAERLQLEYPADPCGFARRQRLWQRDFAAIHRVDARHRERDLVGRIHIRGAWRSGLRRLRVRVRHGGSCQKCSAGQEGPGTGQTG